MKFLYFGKKDISNQGHQSNQVNQCICTTTFSAPPENSRQEALEEASVQGKNNLSKVGSWEQLSDKPQNSLPRPILTYHFLVLIGALVHIIFFYTTQKNTRYNYNYTIYTKRKYIASTNLSFFNSSNYGTVGSMLSATAVRIFEKKLRKVVL